MNLRTIAARTAVAGAATALATGALVGVTAPANAVDASTDYSCQLTSPLAMPLGTFNLAVSTPVIPPSATAGQSFPGDLLGLTAVLTIPSPTGAMLASYGVDHADAADYAVGLGSSAIKAPLAFGKPAVKEDGSATVDGTGSNKPFTLPVAGTYKAMLPKAFTLATEVTLAPGGSPTPATIACSTDAPGDLGSVQVTKGLSGTKAKVAKTAKGYKLTAAVSRIGDKVVAKGKVVAKVGKKSYAASLKSGKATFALPKSAKGKKVVVTYKGDGYTQGSKATVKIK